MKNLVLTAKEQAIINIIADHIFHDRIYDGIHTVLNAFAPNESDHSLQGIYGGIGNAFTFMDIVDDDLCYELSDIFYNTIGEPHEFRNVNELAEVIYYSWLKFIKDYYIVKKAS
ncbi:hypothetical protein BBD31_01505 [Elizabethkingia anophelis]|uniref:hypothetical protein n=1 Tax=Elizabethkingia anophelis TaxID=1117645 RepID=UPI000994CE72|nr:hypothetical protein [Elizabethkingia anophelis]AQW96651.1 hypothetical protein BBD31_01505 [Elizabethkingia anophelis]OPB50100.1 hypothetical protein BAY04_07000 [Elizabethkingia anophelis]SPW16745.1 Uncharacterised protein [Elizabethkingia anophelis]